MSIVLAHPPHFADQPAGVQVFWGCALLPDRVGNFVTKPMTECHGAEALRELCGHLRFDLQVVRSANCIPGRMPCITSMFRPRAPGDRPLPVPLGSKKVAFIGQFVGIEGDGVFAAECRARAEQVAVCELPGIDQEIPPGVPHGESLRARFEALVKAFE